MASESSSSVLNMNDADNEDTEAPNATDDPGESAPLIMEHGYDIAVKVDAPIKQLSTLETFVTYRVRCVCARWPTPPYVRRRYNHFKSLHKRLAQAHPLIAPPPLPPLHTARQQLDRYSPSFVAIRTMALHAFLDRVAKHPILTYSEDFRIFLTTPDDELDKIFKSEYRALNLWGLGNTLSYGGGESKPTNGARVKDPEFTSAIDYLQSLQHKLTTLCSLSTKMHKGTAALNIEYMNMKRVCDSWSAQCGGAECRGAGAAGAGAGAAARGGGARGVPLEAALLPLLAAHASAHAAKITQRDALHAAYVSGGSGTDDLHNRLEQASEAIRSELSDWTPKTRADLKRLLLDLADRKVATHSQTLMGWEHALRLCSETDVNQLFKTVSKTAVLNLSPTKCRVDATPTETERDLDDLEADSNDSISRDGVTDFDNVISEMSFDASVKNREHLSEEHQHTNGSEGPNVGKLDLGNYNEENSLSDARVCTNDDFIQDILNDDTELKTGQDIKVKEISTSNVHKGDNNINKNGSEELKVGKLDLGNYNEENCLSEARVCTSDDFIKDILNDDSELKTEKYVKAEETSSVDGGEEKVKTDVTSDPLRDFSEVDLS